MAGTEQMEWNQTPGNHVFYVFDTIPAIPLQPLPQAHPPHLRYPNLLRCIPLFFLFKCYISPLFNQVG
jgi:hypothetical protein